MFLVLDQLFRMNIPLTLGLMYMWLMEDPVLLVMEREMD
jgi:hypothetical protein